MKDIQKQEVLVGDIDGNIVVFSLLLPIRQNLARTLPHIFIQLCDHSAFFQNR